MKPLVVSKNCPGAMGPSPGPAKASPNGRRGGGGGWGVGGLGGWGVGGFKESDPVTSMSV